MGAGMPRGPDSIPFRALMTCGTRSLPCSSRRASSRSGARSSLDNTLAVFLSTYAHLIDEFEDRERIDADAEIAKARRKVGPRLVRTTVE